MGLVCERSYETITRADLKKLRDLAIKERASFFRRNPKYMRAYRDRLIVIALCQGAALHYIDHKTGVKDFDIWWFYAGNDQVRYPYRAIRTVDSKLEKFGVHPDYLRRGFVGRHVDLMGREIDSEVVERNKGDPIGSIVGYLKGRATPSSRELAKKAVVGLWPDRILGQVVWPIGRLNLLPKCGLAK